MNSTRTSFVALLLAAGLCAGCFNANGETSPDGSSASDGGPLVDAGTGGGIADGGGEDTGPAPAPVDAGFVAAGHRPFPQLLPGEEMTMHPLTLVIVTSAGDPAAAPLTRLTQTLMASDWWNDAEATYGLSLGGVVAVTGPAISTPMTDVSVRGYLEGITADGGPAPDTHTLYLLYLPEGTKFSTPDATWCSFYGPYPDPKTSLGDAFEVVTYGGASCQPIDDDRLIEAATSRAAFTLMDAVPDDPACQGWHVDGASPNDPNPPWESPVLETYIGPGCFGPSHLCDGARIFETGDAGTVEATRYFSNAAAADGGDPCIPAIDMPYFNVTAADWTAADGGSVSIPLTGWSTAPLDWSLEPHLVRSSPGFAGLPASAFPVTTDLGNVPHGGCTALPAMRNGANGTLTVQVPPGAKSGDWAIFSIHSFQIDPATCWQPLAGDHYHYWPVGVYLP